MKWRKKKPPQLGLTRTSRPFAFLPEEMDDGHWVWLERFEVTEEMVNFFLRGRHRWREMKRVSL